MTDTRVAAGTPVQRHFAETANRTLRLAHQEAKKSGCHAIQAEHLLLALSSTPVTASGRFLIEAGLGREQLKAAMQEERRRSLAFAGIEPLGEEQASASCREGQMRLAASARLAIQRGAEIGHREQRVRLGTDLLLGILEADVGTVPRILAVAGVSRDAITGRIEREE